MFPVAVLPSSWYYREGTPWGRNNCQDIMIRPEPPLNREPSACPSGLVEFGSSILQTCGRCMLENVDLEYWGQCNSTMHGERKVIYSGKVGLSATEELKVRLEVILGASLMWYLGHDVNSLLERIQGLLAPNMHLTLCSANVSSLSRKADKIRTNGCRTTINLK